jgi:protein Tex
VDWKYRACPRGRQRAAWVPPETATRRVAWEYVGDNPDGRPGLSTADTDLLIERQAATELRLELPRVQAAAGLLAEGATIPFIARYRKEATGSLDEVELTAVRDRLEALRELGKRREAVLRSLAEREILSPELEKALRVAATLAEVEDLYLPFRPKRRTRASIARERGLEPLADRLMAQDTADRFDPLAAAASFVDEEKGVGSADEALAGARDIIAERASEDARARGRLRALFERRGLWRAKVARGKEQPGAKYRDYFDWQERADRAPSHRVLAMLRGEAEGFLSLRLAAPEEEALSLLLSLFVRGWGPAADQVRSAVEDGYHRLLGPSLETEARAAARARPDAEAIAVFAANLRELLLTPPLGERVVLAVDPGFRTGCKIAVLDSQGDLLRTDTVQPHASVRERERAAEKVREAVRRHEVTALAVGNGTAGRETETFLRGLDLGTGLPVVMVNEAGASVYSASALAREEFPDLDVSLRGAVSIGRRLQDPLAELVKLDPKSIGVGQYQHDVDQAALRRALEEVVGLVVNAVGVQLNTASAELLRYVSGIGPGLAAAIVRQRTESGPFSTRTDLRRVPRLGPKAFEQAAGFLRIRGGPEPLDASAVHPESYRVVRAMARDQGADVADLLRDPGLRDRIRPERYVDERVGLPTVTDIMSELAKPGRDPRGEFSPFSFAPGVSALEDLEPGMRLPGIVTNVTAFGAFVDVGVHQDGLVHVSRLADRFVRDPAEVVKVGQQVSVSVLEVDRERCRISLSMRD